MSADRRRIDVRCCIVGGGPAGMMLALLLARAGVDVLVLEKHGDFLRDFRGDTVHPSTLAILEAIGLLDDFLRIPHRRETAIEVRFADGFHRVADFEGLAPFPYMALAPQWDLLDLLARAAKRHPGFSLRMATEATALRRDADGRVTGVSARDAEGPLDIHADLVIGCDGRDSVLRRASGLAPTSYGAPMDVLWFRLPRAATDIDRTYAAPARGRMMVMLDRDDYWQCAYLIRKGSGGDVRSGAIEAFRDQVAALLPFEPGRLAAIGSWDDVKLLEVRVDRLAEWHLPGLLLIGDAAHAMSPIGGVGINLAVQDAVATANLVGPRLRDGGPVPDALLARVARRRRLPTVVIQRIQRLVQDRLISRLLAAEPGGLLPMPPLLRFLTRFAAFRRVPGRVFGYGIRRERPRLQPR